MLRLIIATVIVCGIAVALLSVRVLLKRGGRFRIGHACKFGQPTGRRQVSRKSDENYND